MTAVWWLISGFLPIFAYMIYEALVWPLMDILMPPKLRRPWTIRRFLHR